MRFFFRQGVLLLLALFWTGATAATTNRVLLQESPVAGFQYHEGKAVWDAMHEGDVLDLVRESDNPHDARAVRVEWRGHLIGYVPRRENAAVARFLDRGVALEARIVRLVKSSNPWRRVAFEVTLPVEPDAANGVSLTPLH
jgi:hypothetical protein